MVRQESYGDIPTFKSLLTGCDNWGTIIDEYGPYKDQTTGRWMKKYFIVPSEHLVKNYPWLLEEGRMIDTKYGPALWVEYPNELVNDKSTSKTNAIVRVYCAFDGGETHETERHKYYTIQIKDLEKENNLLNESNAYYMEMYGNALKDIKTLAIHLAQITDILSKGGRKDDEEDEEKKK